MREQSPIIKLDATDSTNLHLKNLLRSKTLADYTVVVTAKQLKGRGQMGAEWVTENGKNLTFSVLKNFESLQVVQQFNLNICISLAVYAVLKELSIPDLRVKWPNDIMSGSTKICGILIENVLKGKIIQHSIIGIGLNVNQISFKNLEKVSSLKLLTAQHFDLDELLTRLLEKLRHYFIGIEGKSVPQMLPAYEKVLFRKDKPSTFKNVDDEVFMGFIRGVSSDGKLVLELEDNVFKEYGLKEVKLLY